MIITYDVNQSVGGGLDRQHSWFTLEEQCSAVFCHGHH